MGPPAMAFQALTLTPLPFSLHSSRRRVRVRVLAVAADQTPPPPPVPPSEPANSPNRLLRELAQRKKAVSPKKKHPPRRFILKPPLDDERLTRRFLSSPQLSLKALPLLSSCLPSAPLSTADRTWMDEYLLEAKQALGYPLAPSETLGEGDDCPARHFDVLLYLAFQHLDPSSERTRTRHVRNGHSRLWFLGQYVLELAFCEFFLQRYPRESPGPMRERVFALIGKKVLPRWLKAASLHNLVFPYDDLDKMIRKDREPPSKAVFWAIFGAIYLCFGMPEVYRVLFEAFGMDPDDESCQPKLRRQLEDVDYVSVEFEKRLLTWQDVAAYRPPPDALFAHPRLFRACVPPGMHRFRGNIWDFDSRPKVMNTLGYPLPMNDRIPEITEARNIELGLGLQLCFLHPSKHKFEHPRFCYERLEYVGQKIQCLATVQLAKSNAEGLNFYVPGSSNGREATHEAPRCTRQVAGGEASEDVDEQVLWTVPAGQAPAALHYLRGDSARQIRTQSTSKESFNDLCPASATWSCILCLTSNRFSLKQYEDLLLRYELLTNKTANGSGKSTAAS
ncbi:unnamed protein product [Miscanthus lutarioriparius]|uniref:RNase III domain-containing protein n=1 Tax=Miscanthus lutarioriparius TaxID=422564 RepID=A0A811P7T2_9POAL|nr:unnamed protein product [Miscanthus lutarioriparius]